MSLPFIPNWFDDAGLTPAEFRIYCRVCRRVNCFESLASMERGLRMERERIQRAIGLLVSKGFLTRTKRPGQTCLLTAIEPSGIGGLGGQQTQRHRRADTQPEGRANHLAASAGYKVTPHEVNPNKGGRPKFLSELKMQRDETRKELEKYQKYSNSTNNPDKKASLEKQCDWLSKKVNELTVAIVKAP